MSTIRPLSLTPTIYGAGTVLASRLGIPLPPQEVSLNKKLGILDEASAGIGEYPRLDCLCIGNRGMINQIAANGVSIQDRQQHRCTSIGLYGQIPMLVRPLDNDIPQDRRAKYRLRNVIISEVDGLEYYAYWGLKLDVVSSSIEYIRVTTVDGVVTVTAYEPPTEVMSPEPDDLYVDGAQTSESVLYGARALITILISAEDITELLNVAKTIYGDERLAIINEISLCEGIERVVSVPSTTGNVNFAELIECRPISHSSTKIDALFNNGDTTLTMSLGTTMPLLNTSDIVTPEVIGYT